MFPRASFLILLLLLQGANAFLSPSAARSTNRNHPLSATVVPDESASDNPQPQVKLIECPTDQEDMPFYTVSAILDVQHPSTSKITIERVTTADKCLDVLMFRSMSLQSDRSKNGSKPVSESAAAALKEQLKASHSTRSYEAFGGKTIQFAAMTPLLTPNQVVGAVEATAEEGIRARTFELPARVHIKNLRVQKDHRRKGLATALLSAVENYARNEAPTVAKAISLKVEPSINPNAAKLYQWQGFEFQDHVYAGFMIKDL